MRPRIGISKCLLDAENRLNGARACHRFLTEELGAHVEWVPYAADVETGLGALWETWRLTGQGRLVEHGRAQAAAAGLPAPAALDGYVAKADPRGLQGVPWYPEDGRGVFALRLSAAFPLLPVANDRTLEAADARARFVERVFARARVRELFAGGWRPRDLVAFHTRHKLQLLAHSPACYQRAGRLVATAGSRPPGEIETSYSRIFAEALASEVTRGRNANAMYRVFRRVADGMEPSLRTDLLDQIHAYERGELPYSVPILRLASQASGTPPGWAAEQTYLNPYPDGLRGALWDGGTALAPP